MSTTIDTRCRLATSTAAGSSSTTSRRARSTWRSCPIAWHQRHIFGCACGARTTWRPRLGGTTDLDQLGGRGEALVGLEVLPAPVVEARTGAHAPDRALGRAVLLRVELPLQVGLGVPEQRDREGAALLGAPADVAVLVDIEVAGPGAALERRVAGLDELGAVVARLREA